METKATYLQGKVNLTFPIKGKIEGGYVWLRSGAGEVWKRWYYVGVPNNNTLLGQGFGQRPEYYIKYGLAGHNGNDYPIPEGTCLYAVADYKISRVNDPIPPTNYQSGYGGFVELFCQQDGIYFTHLMGHISDALVKMGDSGHTGDLIALSGNTGDSTGAHVHMTFRECDQLTNVKNYTNGFLGALDDLMLYDDILIHRADDMEKLYQYAKATNISYIGLGGSDNFAIAQVKLGLSGVPLYGKAGYMYFSVKKLLGMV